MNNVVMQTTKLAADTATGVTVAEVNDQNSLIVTLVTIVSRLVLEWVLNRRRKK